MKARTGGLLFRVTSPTFTALFQLTASNTQVWWASPLLVHMERWTFEKARSYCWGKGWTLHRDIDAKWIEEVKPSAVAS